MTDSSRRDSFVSREEFDSYQRSSHTTFAEFRRGTEATFSEFRDELRSFRREFHDFTERAKPDVGKLVGVAAAVASVMLGIIIAVGSLVSWGLSERLQRQEDAALVVAQEVRGTSAISAKTAAQVGAIFAEVDRLRAGQKDHQGWMSQHDRDVSSLNATQNARLTDTEREITLLRRALVDVELSLAKRGTTIDRVESEQNRRTGRVYEEP